MARVSPVHSDDGSVKEGSQSSVKATKVNSKKGEEPMDVDAENASGSEEESEYEIEAILDAKRGSFPNVRQS